MRVKERSTDSDSYLPSHLSFQKLAQENSANLTESKFNAVFAAWHFRREQACEMLCLYQPQRFEMGSNIPIAGKYKR